MARENSIPSGMSTLPTTVNNTVNKINDKIDGFYNSRRIVRVTSINPKDGSITFESLVRNIGKSSLGNPLQINKAKLENYVNFAIPKVGELIELYSAPGIALAENKDQNPYETYYRPAPIAVWENQNNNIILDETVPGQAPEIQMANFDLNNYQNALNGFV